jgi:hypothetical protein
LDTSKEVEVESLVTSSVAAPADPATVESASGVKIAVSSSGDVTAANELWHVAVGIALVTGSFMHAGLIGRPLFSNVMVPDSEAAVLVGVTDATNVTLWFVTDAVGEATSDVLLPLVVCPNAACPLTLGLTEMSVAVTVAGPGVTELLTNAL